MLNIYARVIVNEKINRLRSRAKNKLYDVVHAKVGLGLALHT